MNLYPDNKFDSQKTPSPFTDKPLTFQDLIGKDIPQEVLQSLVVENRIVFPLKPTIVSAVSTPGDTPPVTPDQEISGFIDEIKNLEDVVEQLEDMADELLKDMNIPPDNDSIAEAAKNLGSPDGSINKQVFDTALANIDYFPIMAAGQDPVLGIYTGDGEIDAPFLQCNEITKGLADTFKTVTSRKNLGNTGIRNQISTSDEKYNKSMQSLWIHLINSLWWNVIWVRFIVDIVIINPARSLVANPVDRLILFFKKIKSGSINLGGTIVSYPNKGRFRIPNKEHLIAKGPINKLLNKIRRILLCLPFKTKWGKKNYRPPADPLTGRPFDCQFSECTPKDDSGKGSDPSDKFKDGIGGSFDTIVSDDDDECIQTNELFNDKFWENPDKFGAPPECIKSSMIVVNAVMEKALSFTDSSTQKFKEFYEAQL